MTSNPKPLSVQFMLEGKEHLDRLRDLANLVSDVAEDWRVRPASVVKLITLAVLAEPGLAEKLLSLPNGGGPKTFKGSRVIKEQAENRLGIVPAGEGHE